MKLLMAVSSIDLAEKPLATRSWWSLFRAMSELGHELTVLPFLGRAIETPWWKPWENPSPLASSLIYSEGKSMSRFPRVKSFYKNHYGLILAIPKRVVARNWLNSIDRFVRSNGRVDAIIFYSVPLNLIADVPDLVQSKWGIPSIYYEADMPEILPSYGGFHFTYYLGADLSQFQGFLSNAEGAKEVVSSMGAKNVGTLHWAVDPKIFTPLESSKNIDVFYSGGSNRFRFEWIKKMLWEPALELPDRSFAVSGRSTEEAQGVKRLGFLEFEDWKKQINSSNICLNISRSPHATFGGTSTLRAFELGSMGSCIVSNPHKGMEDWFEPGKEIVILKEGDRPAEIYDWLLGSPQLRQEIGQHARERVLREHTYEHRAKELSEYVRKVT